MNEAIAFVVGCKLRRTSPIVSTYIRDDSMYGFKGNRPSHIVSWMKRILMKRILLSWMIDLWQGHDGRDNKAEVDFRNSRAGCLGEWRVLRLISR